MWRGNKRIIFQVFFYTEDNWHAFIKPQFVFVYKAYDSTE